MPEGREWRLLIGALVASDLLAYLGGLLAAAWLVAQPGLGAHMSRQYWMLILLVLPVVTGIFVSQPLYDRHSLLGGTREYSAVLRACTYGVVALILLSFAIHLPVAREWTVLSGLLCATLMGGGRFLMRRLALRLRRRGLFTSPALLVGADAQGAALARQLSASASGLRLVGVLDDYLPAGTPVTGKLRVLGASSLLAQATVRTGARDIIVVPQALPWESLQALLGRATAGPESPRVHLVGGFYDLLAAGVQLSERNGVPLLTVKKVALTRFEAALKRALDCGLGVALLVLLAPVSVVELLQLGLAGARPVERKRVFDRGGKVFEQLTFAGALAGRSALVRKLPSLVNVLAGQLSIVGPRPVAADGDSPQAEQRNPFALRPGLTGLWRESQDPGEQALLDLYYVRGYSVWLDVQILFGRVKARLGMPGDSLLGLDPEVRVA